MALLVQIAFEPGTHQERESRWRLFLPLKTPRLTRRPNKDEEAVMPGSLDLQIIISDRMPHLAGQMPNNGPQLMLHGITPGRPFGSRRG
jgi:hypothetical protein